MNRQIFLNASALKRSACDQMFAYNCVDGLVSDEYIEYFTFGKALHKFAEMYTRAQAEKPMADFMELSMPPLIAAVTQYEAENGQDTARLRASCMAYEDIIAQLGHPLEVAGKAMVENWFEIPYNGVILCGTVDRIGFDGKWIDVYDYKSSRKWDQEKLLLEYEKSTQFPFYVNAVMRWPEAFCTDPAFVAAAKAGNIRMNIVPCFINRKDKNKEMAPQWRIGPPIWYTRKQLDEYMALLDAFIPSIIAIYRLGYGMKNGWISDLCRTCPFTTLCHEADPESAAVIRKEMFKQKDYNPKHYT